MPVFIPVLPVALTETDDLDLHAQDPMLARMLAAGAGGVFSVCLSGEMYHLSEAERVAVAHHAVASVGGRVPVYAVALVEGPDPVAWVASVETLAKAGVDAVVLVTGQLAGVGEPESALRDRVMKLFDAVPGVSFGLYECPLPYKRCLSPALLGELAATGRLAYYKDVCRDADIFAEKVRAVAGSNLLLSNAHAATALASLRAGGGGLSCIAGNLVPELAVWLCKEFGTNVTQAEEVQSWLTVAEVVTRVQYPLSAKRWLQYLGIPVALFSRAELPPLEMETELGLCGFRSIMRQWYNSLGIAEVDLSASEVW